MSFFSFFKKKGAVGFMVTRGLGGGMGESVVDVVTVAVRVDDR